MGVKHIYMYKKVNSNEIYCSHKEPVFLIPKTFGNRLPNTDTINQYLKYPKAGLNAFL